MRSSVSAPASSPVVTPAPVESGSQRVLIVDADPSTRSILEVALKRSGFDVSSATSGSDAMTVLASGELPAVVVLSSDLHGEDGYSLCAQLRGEARTEHLPVLLLARRDEEERLALAEAVGADDLVAKPAFARDIAALVVLRIAPKDAQGFSLDTSILALSWATRALLSAHRGGQIRFGDKALIGFRNGRITHAEVDGSSGMDSLVRILALGRGPYRVQFTLPTTAPTLDVPLRELVSGIFPRLAKWDLLADRSVPLDQRFEVDFAALARSLPSIPDAVNDVVRLFDGRRTVRSVLFDSPLNEIITLEVANRLHLMGVVRPVAGEETVEELVELKHAPKLFEPVQSEAAERMNDLFGTPRDFSDAIPTPPETPIARADAATGADWYEAPHGSGLDVSDATEGWQVQTGLVQDIQQHLVAFNIQSEIEPSEAGAATVEVAAFNEGTPSREPHSPLEHAISPIPLTDVLPQASAPTPAVAVRTLEESFFAEGAEEEDWATMTRRLRRAPAFPRSSRTPRRR